MEDNIEIQEQGFPSEQYAFQQPYPPIQVERRNLRYARLLALEMASPQGEMTAITQYINEGWQLKECREQAANAMLKVAMVEMHHLDMLGQLAVQLGGRARLCFPHKNRWIPWNGNMLDYRLDSFERIMIHNIAAEQDAIHMYAYHISLIKDEYIAAVLNRIILDEEVHIAVFKKYLSRMK